MGLGQPVVLDQEIQEKQERFHPLLFLCRYTVKPGSQKNSHSTQWTQAEALGCGLGVWLWSGSRQMLFILLAHMGHVGPYMTNAPSQAVEVSSWIHEGR